MSLLENIYDSTISTPTTLFTKTSDFLKKHLEEREVFVSYEKGDETSFHIKFLFSKDGRNYFEDLSYPEITLDATGNYRIIVKVSDVNCLECKYTGTSFTGDVKIEV